MNTLTQGADRFRFFGITTWTHDRNMIAIEAREATAQTRRSIIAQFSL